MSMIRTSACLSRFDALSEIFEQPVIDHKIVNAAYHATARGRIVTHIDTERGGYAYISPDDNRPRRALEFVPDYAGDPRVALAELPLDVSGYLITTKIGIKASGCSICVAEDSEERESSAFGKNLPEAIARATMALVCLLKIQTPQELHSFTSIGDVVEKIISDLKEKREQKDTT